MGVNLASVGVKRGEDIIALTYGWTSQDGVHNHEDDAVFKPKSAVKR